MCPEFASGRMEKDWHTAEKRPRNDRTSTARTDVRYRSDKQWNVMQTDKWDSSSHRAAHVADREPRCSQRRKNYSNDDTYRKPSTEQSTSSSEYRRKEYIHLNDRSRSPSPGHRLVFSKSDSSTRREARNNSRIRRHAGNLSQEKSPYRDRTSNSTLSTYTRSARPVEQDRYADIGTRLSANERDSLKYKEACREKEERASCSWSKCSYTDVPNSSDRNIRGTRLSSRHSGEHVTDDCSPRRRCSYSNRLSHDESYEDIRRHSRHLSFDCTTFSSCAFTDNNDCSQFRTNVCDEHNGRTSRRNMVSPVHSKNELNSKLFRDRRDEDNWRTRTGDRRRSSPADRFTSKEDNVVSMRKQRSYSDGRQSSSRDSHHGSTDKANSASSFEESTSKEQKLSERYRESLLSCGGIEKTVRDVREHTSDGRASSQCINKDESSIFQTKTTHFLHTNPSVLMAATDADMKRCFTVTAEADNSCLLTRGRTDPASSSSQYCVVTSWPAAEGSRLLGSLTQPVIQSNMQYVGSSDPVAGVRLLRAQWPASAVMPQHTATGRTRHDFVPTAAVTQLPLLSTRMSAVPSSIDPRKLGVSGVSLNSNINLSTMPSNASFNLAAIQPVGVGSVGHFMMDNVYGESPLLDEPTYNSPVAIQDSSINLVGSSVSSVDHMRPIADMELKKMLDVVAIAKTTLEQTLPSSCHVDPYSLKQQKVLKASFNSIVNFVTYLFICASVYRSLML